MHSLRRWPRGSPLLVCLLLLTSGCAFVTPRFSQDVQASFARDEMRKLTTRSMELYYPEQLRPTALRIAARVEACVDRLRDLSWSKRPRDRLLIYLTSEGFNNAYVQPDIASIPQQMVMPTSMSLELFHLMDLGNTELGDVGCHEAVHYVQMQQVEGLWHGLNLASGGIIQPNVFTESWFLEGLATYYEGHFDRETGRPHSPIWRGWFESMAAARGGELNPGYLSPEHRQADPFGGSYLTGSHFVAWLVRTYGEKKLWALIHEQAQSWAPPFAVTLRFRRVYGKSIGALFDDFSASLKQELEKRERPASQAVLVPEVGYFSRMTVSPRDGATALVHVGREETSHLTVRERDGSVRFSRNLTLLLPGREWLIGNPSVMSGLSFTRDGALLYLVALDVDSQSSYLSRLWRVDARTGEVLRTWELGDGIGGSVTPDGTGYVYVDTRGDTANLVRLNLESGQKEPLTRFEGHVSLGAPAVSPDGQRVVFSMRGPTGWDLALLEQDGSVRSLTQDGLFNYSARWVDGDQVLFLREHERRLQAHVLKLSGGELLRITDAPYLVMDAQPTGDGQVAFLNRDGFNFSLDRAPLTALAGSTPQPAPASVATAPAPSDTPTSPEPQVEVLSDEPYSPIERILYPELRIPLAFAYQDPDTKDLRVVGLISLAGQDRLGFHAWAINASYDSGARNPSIGVSYGNAQLAPWYLLTSVGYARDEDQQDLLASLSASRSFWSTPVSFGLFGLRRQYLDDGEPEQLTSLFGPEIGTSYFAGESTAYGGTQRGLGLSLSAGLFPRAFGTSDTMGDVRAEVETYLGGLPFLDRDNLYLSLAGRFLPGAPLGLLEVGGIASGATVSLSDSLPSPSTPRQYDVGVAFAEYLRGYEDFTVRARHVVIGSAQYRYRFIIDYGWASTLYLLPSLFVRQLEVEGFGSWARTDARDTLRAAGGAVRLNLTLGSLVPVGLYYQYAHRFDRGLDPLHLFGVAF